MLPLGLGVAVGADGSRSNQAIGTITSGGFGPSVDGPVAMGYVGTGFAKDGTAVQLVVRGKPMPARVTRLPFVAPGYKRG